MPGSRREAIQEVGAGLVRVRVTAPPEKGRANEALVALLARSLGVSQGAVRIVRGAASRRKAVAVEGVTTEEAVARLRRQVEKG